MKVVTTVLFIMFISGCASGNYTTKSGKKRNAWVDLLVVAAAIPSDGDSHRTRAKKSGFIKGYLSDESKINDESNCGCPYDTAKDGSRCGARSAWTKPGGDEPYCNYRLITSEDIDAKQELRGR